MKRSAGNLIAVLVTIVVTVAVFWKIDLVEIRRLFSEIRIMNCFIFIVIFMVVTIFRVLRWQFLLPKRDGSFSEIMSLYSFSNILNIFLPARAGDIFRGVFYGEKYGISKIKVIGTIVAERIVDGLTVIGILGIGILLYYRSQMVLNVLILGVTIFVLSFFVMYWICKYNKTDKICAKVKEIGKYCPNGIACAIVNGVDKVKPYINLFVEGFNSFTEPKRMFFVTACSIIAWIGDSFLIYFLFNAFGVKAHIAIAFFVISFIALSTVIPQASMYIGMYQGAFIIASDLFGVGKSVALSVSLVQQVLILVSYLLFSQIFIWKNKNAIAKIRKRNL